MCACLDIQPLVSGFAANCQCFVFQLGRGDAQFEAAKIGRSECETDNGAGLKVKSYQHMHQHIPFLGNFWIKLCKVLCESLAGSHVECYASKKSVYSHSEVQTVHSTPALRLRLIAIQYPLQLAYELPQPSKD